MRKVKSKKVIGKNLSYSNFGLIKSVKTNIKKNTKFLTFSFLFFTFSLLLCFSISAQPPADDRPEDLVPPPLNIISEDEQEKLEAEDKMKERTKLALEFMEARIIKSEELLKSEDYTESLNQLGYFQGIIIDTMKFLKRNQNDKAVLKHYKKLEMSLRDFMPRLELIRREMPYKYGYHVKYMLFFVRDTRSKALNPLFDDTVLPEGNN